MNLEDALGTWPSGGNNQSGGQPSNNTWPGPSGGGSAWPGGPSGGGSAWPGGPSGGGSAWPGGPSGGGSAWPGGPSGGGSAWPGGPSGGGSPWPGGPSGGGPSAPGGCPSPSGPGGWPSPSPPGRQQTLTVPFEHKLQRGVHDKLLITITGVIKPNADKITVDLSTGRDLAFHFNPRFNEGGRKVIVRNSHVHGKWGIEERALKAFPFVRGQPFEMKILCTSCNFRVAVDSTHLLEYEHRIRDLSSITHLSINNDLNLTNFKIETLP